MKPDTFFSTGRMHMAAACILGLNLWVSASAATVHEQTLDNGLKVIVQQDHRAPVVVSEIWYKVGSSYEADGHTGLSHMLEHMMFKGTKATEPGEFSRIIAENGGRENAFTGQDFTAYFEQLEASRLEVSFRLEADRMRNLQLAEAEFAKERSVVAEERRLRTEDSPTSLTMEKAMSVAFQTSPYRQPIIGWMADIENYSLPRLQQWYERWYTPNNATLVVVGDVKPDEVFRLAKQYFGPIPRREITPPAARPEADQIGEKRIIVREQAKVPFLFMGYKVPSLTTALQEGSKVPEEEVFALEVLAGSLDGGESARLNRHLVRGGQIAASASVGYDLFARLDTLFQFSGVPAQHHDVGQLEAAFKEQIARIQQEPIEPNELERVKTQVITSDIYERDSTFYQAMIIGMLETVGLDWRVKDRYIEKVKAVTATQVQQVAKKYLVPDGLTVAILQPVDKRS